MSQTWILRDAGDLRVTRAGEVWEARCLHRSGRTPEGHQGPLIPVGEVLRAWRGATVREDPDTGDLLLRLGRASARLRTALARTKRTVTRGWFARVRFHHAGKWAVATEGKDAHRVAVLRPEDVPPGADWGEDLPPLDEALEKAVARAGERFRVKRLPTGVTARHNKIPWVRVRERLYPADPLRKVLPADLTTSGANLLGFDASGELRIALAPCALTREEFLKQVGYDLPDLTELAAEVYDAHT